MVATTYEPGNSKSNMVKKKQTRLKYTLPALHCSHEQYINRNFRKRTFGYMRPANVQFSLRIRAVWSESSLGAFWIVMDAKFLNADKDDWSDCAHAQTDLSLCWAHMQEDTFFHVALHLGPVVQSVVSLTSSLRVISLTVLADSI